MKRFTETSKWDDPWYRHLSPATKHLWQWLLDHCDISGVVDPDLELASFQIGQLVKEENITELGDRIKVVDKGKLLIVKFIQFQFGTLSEHSRVHQSVIRTLNSHSIEYPYPINTLSQPQARGSRTPKVQEKEKDKEGVQGEIKPLPEKLSTPRMTEIWEKWKSVRRSYKKPKSWQDLFNSQVDWLSQFDEPSAFEAVSASIRNGWQGLFEPKRNSGNHNASQRGVSNQETRDIFRRADAAIESVKLQGDHATPNQL